MGISLGRDQMRQRVSSVLVDFRFLFNFSTSSITQKTNFCACSLSRENEYLGLKKDQKVTVLVVPKAKKSPNSPNTKTSIFFTLSQLYDIPKREESLVQTTTSPKGGRTRTKIGFRRKHANIPHLYGVVESKKTFFLILEFHSLTLREFLIDNQSILEHDEVRRRFLFFQIFQVVFFCHKSGFSLGSITPKDIFLNDLLWVYISGFSNMYNPHSPIISSDRFDPRRDHRRVYENADLIRAIGQLSFPWDVESSVFSSQNVFNNGEKVIVPRSRGGYTYGRIAKRLEENPNVYRIEISSSSIFANLEDPKRSYSWKDLHSMSIGKLPNETFGFHASKIDDLQSIILKWQHGEMSNFDYLMTLNALAGRKRGYWKKNPVLPWVIDFEKPDGNWRDLTRTKFRMKKGDRMLDFTFDGPNPHHVTEPLSEIAYFTYLARRTPIKILKKYVRSRFQPREYPSSVKRMFDWTPEECIPEFYTDPSIFESIHPEMEDLELPVWAGSREEFIEIHRNALESEYVSRHLHHWIDLIFGYKLSGKAAIDSKNVIYRKQTSNVLPTPSEYVQLFTRPHPKRICAFFPKIFKTKNLDLEVNFSLTSSSPSSTSTSTTNLSFSSSSSPSSGLLQSIKKRKGRSLSHTPTLDNPKSRSPLRLKSFDDNITSSSHQQRSPSSSSPLRSQLGSKRMSRKPKHQSFYLTLLLSFEETLSFASEFFKKPQYHVLPLRKNNQDFRSNPTTTKTTSTNEEEEPIKNVLLSKEEPVADDYFALGCVLYEIYTFEPLFTTKTMDMYLQGVYKPKYLDQLPVSVRKMVLHLIDLNATNRKKAFEFEIYNKVFPRYFKYCYHILRRYYILTSVTEKYEFAIQQEFRVVELPPQGFFLVFGHIMYDLFSSKQKGWNYSLLLVTRKTYREKIQHCGGCDKMTSYIIKSKLPDLLDNSNDSKEVTLSLLRYSFVDFVFHDLGLSKKEFLEKILGLYVDYLYHDDKDIAKQAYYTLSKVAKNELGILLTLKHIVERLITKILRLCKGRSQQRRSKFSMVFMLFLNLSLILSKETMFTYFFTRFFKIFLRDYLDDKKFTNETILYSMFELLEKILIRLNKESKRMIGHLLLAHRKTIFEVFENHSNEFCSMIVFQKIIKIICYLLHIAARDVRIKVLGHLEPIIGKIFKGEFSIEPIVKQQVSQGYPTASNGKNQNYSSSSSSSSSGGGKSSPTKSGKSLGSTVLGFLKRKKQDSSYSKGSNNSSSSSTSTKGEIKMMDNVIDRKDPSNKTNENGDDQGGEELLFRSMSRRTFETSCMIYRELCCVVGNSAMRESVATAEAFEREIQKASFPPRNKRDFRGSRKLRRERRLKRKRMMKKKKKKKLEELKLKKKKKKKVEVIVPEKEEEDNEKDEETKKKEETEEKVNEKNEEEEVEGEGEDDEKKKEEEEKQEEERKKEEEMKEEEAEDMSSSSDDEELDLADFDKLLTSESYQSLSNLQELVQKTRERRKVPSLYWLIAPSQYDTHPNKLLDVCKEQKRSAGLGGLGGGFGPSSSSFPSFPSEGGGSDYGFRAIKDFTFTQPGKGKIFGLSVLEKDERIFMSYGKDGVYVWNLEIGCTFKNFGGASIRNAEFLESAEGHLALTVSDLSHLQLWDVPRGRPIWSVGGVLDFTRCPHNENVIATISTESTVRFFDLRSKGHSSVQNYYYNQSNARRRGGTRSKQGGSGGGPGQPNQSPPPSYLMNSSGGIVGGMMRHAYEWKVMNMGYHPTLPNRPSLRTIASSQECVFLGLSSGSIVVLDGKTGMMMDQFKAHDREVTKIVPFRRSKSSRAMSSVSSSEMNNLFFSHSSRSNEIKFWSVLPPKGKSSEFDYNPTTFKNTLQINGYQMNNSITSFDLNLENQCLFAIGQSNIVGVAGIGNLESRCQKMQMLDSYDLEMYKMESYKMTKKFEKSTDVKMLPLHKFVLVSTDKGNIHLYR